MADSTGEVFFTPTELCKRWKVDPRTLDKFDLPWVRLLPRVRRVPAETVFLFEKSQRIEVESAEVLSFSRPSTS